MRFAVTAIRPELSSPIEQRFGRARYLLIVDLPDLTMTAIDNREEMRASQDVGMRAAQRVIEAKADALITGHCGPKAFRALQAAGVTVYKVSDSSVAEALNSYSEGELTPAVSGDPDMVIGGGGA